MFNNQIIAGSSGQGGGGFYDFTIDNSVRMSDASNSQIYWQAGTPSSGQIWTASFWFKKWAVGTGQASFEMFGAGSSGAAYMFWAWDGNDKFTFQSTADGNKGSTTGSPVFRDVSAWNHMVIRADTTQSTQADRLRVYHNGEQITTWGTDSIGTSAWDYINASGFNQYWGGASGIANGNPGCNHYLADINFCDGQSYAPTEFGEAKDGIWVPINPSVTYGNNGYRLEFKQTGTSANASGIGADTSGNNNHFTVAGITAHDVVSDSPTNSFCTLSSLTHGTFPTLKEGALSIATAYSADLCGVASTWYPTTGKWYWEVHNENAASSYPYLGITDQRYTNWDATKGSYLVAAWLRTGGYSSTTSYMGTVTIGSVTSWTNNDIIMFALDVDNRKLWIGKNGTWEASGNPAAGTGQNASWTNDTAVSPMWMGYQSQGVDCVFNFGQDGTFAGNQTAQGNADGNGVGDFYYSPPSGFLAMATSNIEEPAIGPNSTTKATDHFDTKLWSADVANPAAGDKQISLDFQPDLVWSKNRDNAENHYWMDSVRGDNVGNKWLRSNSTAAEGADAVGSTTAKYDFTSTGFDIIDTNSGSGEVYYNSRTYVGWCWKAGGATPTQTYTVKVVSDSGNKYRFDDFGTSAVTLELQEGGTYTFDQSDSSNAGHPFRFSTTSNGTHGGGTEYTTGVTTTGTPGSAGAKTTITVASGAPTLYYYCSVHSGMGGQANTNSTFGSSNFKGSIQSVVSANQDAGFSIVSYTGNATDGATVGHGLSQTVEAVIVKRRDSTAHWQYLDKNLSSGKVLLLSSTGAETSYSTFSAGGIDNLGSTTFSLEDGSSNGNNVNANGGTYIAYCFHSVPGYSAIGKFVGNGSSAGPTVNCNFLPSFVLLKKSSAAGDNWSTYDNKRDTDNVVREYLIPNDLQAAGATDTMDFVSNGFKVRNSGAYINTSGATYIYLAFAEAPFKHATAR